MGLLVALAAPALALDDSDPASLSEAFLEFLGEWEDDRGEWQDPLEYETPDVPGMARVPEQDGDAEYDDESN